MNPSATKAEWDAPKNGDFARYVETLTAPRAVALPQEPGRVLRAGESAGRAPAVAGKPQGTDLQATRTPLVAILSSVQVGLVLLALVQLGLLVMAGLGSALGVAAALVAWWGVRHWKQALVPEHGDAPGSSASSALALLKHELQLLADQKRKSDAKK